MLPPLSYYNKDPAPIRTLCWAWSSYRVYQYTSQTSLAWYTLCLYRELPTLLVILHIWSQNFITNFVYISVSSSVPCISINFRFPIASNERSGSFTKAIKLWIFNFELWTHRTLMPCFYCTLMKSRNLDTRFCQFPEPPCLKCIKVE